MHVFMSSLVIFIDYLLSSFLPLLIPGLMILFYINRGGEARELYATERQLICIFFIGLFAFRLTLFAKTLLASLFGGGAVYYDLILPITNIWQFGVLSTQYAAFLFLCRLGVFSKKQKRALCALCIVGLIYAELYSVLIVLDSIYSNAPLLIFASIAVLLVPVFTLCGYFLSKKKSNKWYGFVGLGWPLYIPLILLAILACIVYFACNLFFGDKGDSSPKQTKKYEVTENGVKYIIEETPNGTYFDDSNREWLTDDGGVSFYRKD